MAKKTREDFTDAEIKKMHAEVSEIDTVDGRAAYYKKNGVSNMQVAQWGRAVGLGKVPPAKPGKKTSAKKSTKKAPAKKPVQKVKAAPSPKTAPKKPPTPAKKAEGASFDQDIKDLIALQARVISRLMGN